MRKNVLWIFSKRKKTICLAGACLNLNANVRGDPSNFLNEEEDPF